MAVQAQYPSNAVSPNFKTNNRDASDAFKEHEHLGLVISDPNNNLMCNIAYGSRKRNRDADDATMINQQFQFPIPSKIPKAMVISSGQEAPYHRQNRILGSAGRSTSGSPLQHNVEIDAFIRLHNAKLRSDLCKIQAKHYNQLLRGVQNQAAKRIMEKDSELVSLKRKQSELEIKLNQVVTENRFWYAAAKDSEAAVSALKASLDQALTECHVVSSHAADAESCCYGGNSDDDRRRLMCRVCGERDVAVLVLPCQHLCLCVGCEQESDTCHICYGAKSVGTQVFLD